MTNPGEQQPIIEHVPGMPPVDESQLPNRNVVPIADNDVTPAMMNHAIGSPYNRIGAGLLEKPAETVAIPPQAQHAAETVLAGAGVVVETPSAAEQGNDLSEADRNKIRQEVTKNIALTQMHGSINFNTPKAEQ